MLRTFQRLILNENYIKSISCNIAVLPDCLNAEIGSNKSVINNVVTPSELSCQMSHELSCFNLYDNVENDCLPLKQDSNYYNLMTEFNGS